MLTKELVQATVRNGKLFPKFIKSDDSKALAEAKELVELFVNVHGRVVSELEDEVKGVASTPRARGFAKLLMDQCEVSEASEEVLELRWKAFALSESLRKVEGLAHGDFIRKLAAELNEPIESLQQKLFADLPSARLVEKYQPLSPEDLISKYNLSHVTTFLCFAEDVTVTVSNVSIAQKRELMRRLKFHRLMSDVDVDQNERALKLELSGPLRLFGKSQGYAIRIANFFPFVASLPEWKIDALITWKGKKLAFSVDQTSGVKTKYSRSDGGYIPKEFDQVIKVINDSGDLKIKPGEDFIHLGKQSYCFPDFVVDLSNQSLGVELFHPWHKGQLRHRIEAARRVKFSRLLVGVERSLLKDPEIKAFCDSDPWFQEFGFEFTQFPTPNVIKRAVTKYG